MTKLQKAAEDDIRASFNTSKKDFECYHGFVPSDCHYCQDSAPFFKTSRDEAESIARQFQHRGPKIEVSFHPESDVGRSLAAKSAFNKQEGGDHYKNMASQPFAFVRDNNVGHAEGEAIYRLLRWREKGGIADLRKVIHTVEPIIEYEERNRAP